MPGIAGIIDYLPETLPVEQVYELVGPLKRLAHHRLCVEATPHAAFAAVAIHDEPRVIHQHGVLLAYDGQIVQEAGLRALLTPALEAPSAPLPLVEVMLQLYRRHGPQVLSGLNGLYSIAIWDEREQRLTLLNDRYGMQKLYYWQTGRSVVFASEYKAFSRHPNFQPRINPAAAADLLAVGHPLDDRTLYDGVTLLSPASILSFEANQRRHQRTWNRPYGAENSRLPDETETIREMAALAQQAVQRRITPGACILLTGGLDSRLIAGMARQVAPDMPLYGLSIGQPQADDVITARQIASALHIDFSHLPLTADYLERYAVDGVWQTEGNMNVYASWIFAANRFFARHGITRTLTGIGGEGAAGRHVLLETLNPDPAQALRTIYRYDNFARAGQLLRKDLSAQLLENTLDSFRRTIQTAPAQHPLNRLDYVSFHQYLRRHATSIDVFSDTAVSLDPLLDNDLIDFVLQIPPELRARGYLYKKMIRASLPHLAPIGDALRGPNFKPDLDLQWQKWTALASKLERRIKQTLRRAGEKAADRSSHYIQPNAWLRSGSRAFALGILQQEEYLDDLFDMDAVRRLVQDHMAGRTNDYRAICGLLTIIIWRAQFCSLPICQATTNEQLFSAVTRFSQDAI